jgi:hypothetical protein
MSTIAGTVVNRATVTTVAASSGDGDTIAAMFSGIVIPGISNTAGVSTNSSGTVTTYWPQSVLRCSDQEMFAIVAGIIAADTALTSPITSTLTAVAASTV